VLPFDPAARTRKPSQRSTATPRNTATNDPFGRACTRTEWCTGDSSLTRTLSAGRKLAPPTVRGAKERARTVGAAFDPEAPVASAPRRASATAAVPNLVMVEVLPIAGAGNPTRLKAGPSQL
jgi:hypothetical protein